MEGTSHPFFHTGPGDQVVVELVVHPFAFRMVSGLSVGIGKIVWQAAVKGDASPFATGEPTQRLVRQAGAAVEFPMCKRFRIGLDPGDQVVQVKMPAQFQSSFSGDDFADFRKFHNLTSMGLIFYAAFFFERFSGNKYFSHFEFISCFFPSTGTAKTISFYLFGFFNLDVIL
jgi:hypothetical protein